MIRLAREPRVMLAAVALASVGSAACARPTTTDPIETTVQARRTATAVEGDVLTRVAQPPKGDTPTSLRSIEPGRTVLVFSPTPEPIPSQKASLSPKSTLTPEPAPRPTNTLAPARVEATAPPKTTPTPLKPAPPEKPTEKPTAIVTAQKSPDASKEHFKFQSVNISVELDYQKDNWTSKPDGPDVLSYNKKGAGGVPLADVMIVPISSEDFIREKITPDYMITILADTVRTLGGTVTPGEKKVINGYQAAIYNFDLPKSEPYKKGRVYAIKDSSGNLWLTQVRIIDSTQDQILDEVDEIMKTAKFSDKAATQDVKSPNAPRPAPTAIAESLAQVEWTRQYASQQFPYTMDYPSTWFPATAGGGVDSYQERKSISQVHTLQIKGKPSGNVQRSAEEAAGERIDLTRAEGGTEISKTDLTVDGTRAVLYTYRMPALPQIGAPANDRLIAGFTGGGYQFFATMDVSLAESTNYTQLVKAMLQSIHFRKQR